MRKRVGVVLLVFPLAACGGADEASENPVTETPQAEAPAAVEAADIQTVQVSVVGEAYLFSPETVHAGTPVRLVFDPERLPGCSKSVTLPDFGIAKSVTAEDRTIEFTPQAPGPIAVACSMDMYKGTLQAQ